MYKPDWAQVCLEAVYYASCCSKTVMVVGEEKKHKGKAKIPPHQEPSCFSPKCSFQCRLTSASLTIICLGLSGYVNLFWLEGLVRTHYFNYGQKSPVKASLSTTFWNLMFKVYDKHTPSKNHRRWGSNFTQMFIFKQ